MADAAETTPASSGNQAGSGTEGQYLLPHHSDEIKRLRRQHQHIKNCCDGHLLGFTLPKSDTPVRILDSGCADGTWLKDLAATYPESEFSLHGVDIGTSLFMADPDLDLRQQDLRQPFPESWRWTGSFDLVHQRLLVMAFKKDEWQPVVHNLRGLLRPGGRLQLVECKWVDPDHDMRPEEKRVIQMQTWLAERAGMDISIGEKLVGFLEQEGFDDIQTVCYSFGYGAKAKRPDRESSIDLLVETLKHFADRAGGNIPGVATTPAEFSEFMNRLTVEVREHGYAAELRMVSGRKPL